MVLSLITSLDGVIAGGLLPGGLLPRGLLVEGRDLRSHGVLEVTGFVKSPWTVTIKGCALI